MPGHHLKGYAGENRSHKPKHPRYRIFWREAVFAWLFGMRCSPIWKQGGGREKFDPFAFLCDREFCLLLFFFFFSDPILPSPFPPPPGFEMTELVTLQTEKKNPHVCKNAGGAFSNRRKKKPAIILSTGFQNLRNEMRRLNFFLYCIFQRNSPLNSGSLWKDDIFLIRGRCVGIGKFSDV